jgi:hypothetical protein
MSVKVSQSLFVVLLLGILAFAACRKPEEKLLVPAPVEYRTWKEATEIELNYPVPGHLDHFRRIYINGIGEKVQITERNSRRFYDYPEGTIIVKEIYQGLAQPEDGEEPIALTIMIKNSQDPRGRNKWFWVSTEFDSKQEQIIEHEFCVDCHANANEPHPYSDKNPNNDFRDFVYFPPRRN